MSETEEERGVTKDVERKGGRQVKLLIVSTLEREANQDFQNLLSEECELIATKEYVIKNCIGCNSCWVRTPGKCAIKDDFEFIFQKILLSDTVLFLTEEKMGFVSYEMKNIVDRMIAIDLPFTNIYGRQARHAPRYDKSWNFMLVCPKLTEKEYLSEWLGRMALNFHSASLGVFESSDREGIKDALRNC